MATVTDVLNVLKTNVVSAVYPNGLSSPSTAGVDVTVVSGWPIRNQLDSVLSAGNAFISIFPTNKIKMCTAFKREYQAISIEEPTIQAIVLNNQIVLSGTISVPQAVMVIYNGTGYSYSLLSTDTINSVASNLALLIPGATATGETITTSNPYSLSVNIITNGKSSYELSRQKRTFLIRFWTNSPLVRDNLLNPVDDFFKENYRLTLPDGFSAIAWPMEPPDIFNDYGEKSLQIIGNLEYAVEYPTTKSGQFATIGDVNLNLYLGTQKL